MRKNIISAISLLTICTSVLIGSTYALFTTSDTANIVVTSGKMEVKAKINEGSINTYSQLSDYQGIDVFEKGGYVVYDATASTFSIVNMAPGDVFDFDIDTINNSNVSILYRVKLISNDENASKLNGLIDIDGTNNKLEVNRGTDWIKVSNDSTSGINDKSIKDNIKITLKYDSSYVDIINTNFKIVVEVLQGNAGVATLNGNDYSNIQDAILNANNGDIITLTRDYKFTTNDQSYKIADGKYAHLYIPEDKNIILDLNGCFLSNDDDMSMTDRYDMIFNYGTLRIIDNGSFKGAIEANNGINATTTTSGGFAVVSYGELILDGVKIDGNNIRNYAVIVEGENAKLTIDDSIISGRGGVAIYSGAEAIINSGKIYLDVETTNARDNAIYVSNATLTINGGTVDATLKKVNESTGKGGNAILTQGTSTVNVFGGNFDAAESTLHTYTGGLINVYGGYFNQIVKLHQDVQGMIVLYGGTYKYQPKDNFIPEGYQIVDNSDGTYSVSKV